MVSNADVDAIRRRYAALFDEWRQALPRVVGRRVFDGDAPPNKDWRGSPHHFGGRDLQKRYPLPPVPHDE